MTEHLEPAAPVTVEEAARVLGTTAVSVLLQIKRHRLAAREVDGDWLVDQDSLERFRQLGSASQTQDFCRSACARKGGCGSCG